MLYAFAFAYHYRSRIETRVRKLTAHVSAIFLLPVFEKSVIFNDFRAIAHSIDARDGGNTIWWNAIARKRTVDDSVAYWFPWKHPMARRRALEFGVFDQTPPKMGLSARPYVPRHSVLSATPHKTPTAKLSARSQHYSPLHL